MAGIRSLTKSVWWKLFVGYLCVAIPLYTICMTTIWVSSDIVTRKVQSSVQSKMNLYTSVLDREINNINQMLVALNNDSDLPTLALQIDDKISYERVSLQHNIETKMSIIFYSSSYIRDVYLLFPKFNEQLSLRTGQSKLDAGKQMVLSKVKDNKTQMDHFSADGVLSYVITFSDASVNGVGNDYLLGVDINQDLILDGLKSLEKNDTFSVFLVDNDSDQLVGSSKPNLLDKDIYNDLLQNKLHKDASYVDVRGYQYLVMTSLSRDGIYKMVSYIKVKDMLSPIYTIKKVLWLILGISPLFFVSFSWLVYRHIHRPLRRLVQSMGEVEKGNLEVRFLRKQGDEFGYVYKQCNQMVSQLRMLIQEVLEKKIQLQQSQIKQLQSQINPHFLFNCFYIGYRMAKSGDNENVARLCKYLGDYFRFITKEAQDEIALKDEVSFTKTYLEIQKIRLDDKLSFTIYQDESLLHSIIPSLSLQPIVENAILHGIENIVGPGHIEIHIRSEDNAIRVEVADSGKGMTDSEKDELRDILNKPTANSEHCGLWNVHWRLKNSSNYGSGLKIEDNIGGGLKVSFRIAQ